MGTMFGKIAGASASGGGTFLRDGNYTLLVENVMLEKKFGGETFIAEVRVMASAANGELDEKGNPVVPNKVGSTASMVCNLTKHESAAGNAKAFVLGVLASRGYSEEQITEQLMVEVCDKKVQPLRGMGVECRTYRKVNQGRVNEANKGKMLTLPRWYPIAQDPAAIKAQRAWLDSNKPGSDAGPQAQAVTAPVAAPQPVIEQPAPTPTAAPTPAPSGGLLGSLLG